MYAEKQEIEKLRYLSKNEKNVKQKRRYDSMIRDYQAIMKTWFPVGEQRIIPTYGKHEGVKLVGFLDYETGRVYVEEHSHYDAEVFLQFLKNTLSLYRDGKIVMILDNAKIHHTKLLSPFLEELQGRLEFLFLPPLQS